MNALDTAKSVAELVVALVSIASFVLSLCARGRATDAQKRVAAVEDIVQRQQQRQQQTQSVTYIQHADFNVREMSVSGLPGLPPQSPPSAPGTHGRS